MYFSWAAWLTNFILICLDLVCRSEGPPVLSRVHAGACCRQRRSCGGCRWHPLSVQQSGAQYKDVQSTTKSTKFSKYRCDKVCIAGVCTSVFLCWLWVKYALRCIFWEHRFGIWMFGYCQGENYLYDRKMRQAWSKRLTAWGHTNIKHEIVADFFKCPWGDWIPDHGLPDQASRALARRCSWHHRSHLGHLAAFCCIVSTL